MTPWIIELHGERFDLQELLRLNSIPNLQIEEKNGRFYLRAAEFNSYSNASDVLNRGIEILRVINGIAQIEIQNWENVEAIDVARDEADGTRTQFLFPLPIRARSRVSTNLTVIKADGTIDSSNQKTTMESFFEISRKDTNVERVLRIYGSREHSWSNLCIIYEIIESDVGGKRVIVNNDWSSSSRIGKFKQTANSLTAVGDDARHGKESKDPPPSPMSLSEAEALVESMIRQWILTKQPAT
jgi:hypothetical protein